jgi:hypothetical protein
LLQKIGERATPGFQRRRARVEPLRLELSIEAFRRSFEHVLSRN